MKYTFKTHFDSLCDPNESDTTCISFLNTFRMQLHKDTTDLMIKKFGLPHSMDPEPKSNKNQALDLRYEFRDDKSLLDIGPKEDNFFFSVLWV